MSLLHINFRRHHFGVMYLLGSVWGLVIFFFSQIGQWSSETGFKSDGDNDTLPENGTVTGKVYIVTSIEVFFCPFGPVDLSILIIWMSQFIVLGSVVNSRTRAYCTCSRCGWVLFGHFFSHLFHLNSFSLSLINGPI